MGLDEFITGRKEKAAEYSLVKVADLEDDRVYIIDGENKYYRQTLKGKTIKHIYPADRELNVYPLAKIKDMQLDHSKMFKTFVQKQGVEDNV
jgi:hypothetical protein